MPDSSGSIRVTPPELAALATSVAGVRDRLNATADLLGDYADAVGSPSVALALAYFVSGWRDGRREIATEISELSAMLDQAATLYAQTDGDLANAMPAS